MKKKVETTSCLFKLKSKIHIYGKLFFSFAGKLATRLYVLLLSAFSALIKNIEVIGKKLIWAATTFIVCYAVFNALYIGSKNTTYIKAVELPNEMLTTGRTAESLTQNIIVNVAKLSDSKRADYQKYIDKLNKSFRLDVQACEVALSAFKYNKEIPAIADTIVKKNTEDVEILIPDTGFSIKTLSQLIRKLLGFSEMVLTESVVKDHFDNRYLVQVVATYNSGFSHQSSMYADDITLVEDALSLLTLKYTNSATYASLIFRYDQEAAIESLDLAAELLQKDKKNSASKTLLGYLYIEDDNGSSTRRNIDKARGYFLEAINLNKNDDEARFGLVLANMKYRSANAKIEGYEEDIAELDDLIRKEKYAKEASLLKVEIVKKHYDEKKVLETYQHVLKQFPDEPDVQASYINYLVDIDKVDEADQFSRPIYDRFGKDANYQIRDPKYQPIVLARLRHMLKLKQLDALNIDAASLDKCSRANWTQALHDTYFSESEPSKKELIREVALTQFKIAELKGVASNSFYQDWGILLKASGRNDEAIEKFQEQMKYAGEKTWPLINISGAMQNKGDYKNAEIAARESLNILETSEGAHRYLYSIFAQEDYRRFLNEYEVRRAELLPERLEDYEVLLGVADCKLGDKVDAAYHMNRINMDYSDEDKKHNFEALKNCINP